MSQEQNVRESAMALTCHNCKKPGRKKKDCKSLMGKSAKPNNIKNGTRKWCSYHHSNRHLNENSISSSSSRGKGGARITRAEAIRMTSAIIREMVGVTLPLTVKLQKIKTFVGDSNVTGCDEGSCNGKVESKPTEDDEPNHTPPGIGFSFAMCHSPLSQEADGFRLLVDSGSSKHFRDPQLIHGIESRMLEYTRI